MEGRQRGLQKKSLRFGGSQGDPHPREVQTSSCTSHRFSSNLEKRDREGRKEMQAPGLPSGLCPRHLYPLRAKNRRLPAHLFVCPCTFSLEREPRSQAQLSSFFVCLGGPYPAILRGVTSGSALRQSLLSGLRKPYGVPGIGCRTRQEPSPLHHLLGPHMIVFIGKYLGTHSLGRPPPSLGFQSSKPRFGLVKGQGRSTQARSKGDS